MAFLDIVLLRTFVPAPMVSPSFPCSELVIIYRSSPLRLRYSITSTSISMSVLTVM